MGKNTICTESETALTEISACMSHFFDKKKRKRDEFNHAKNIWKKNNLEKLNGKKKQECRGADCQCCE